jgi:cell division protein FtsQ
VLADEEPKYLRRQKPLEIRRRKFGKKAWKTYLRITMWTATGIAGAWAAYVCGHFLLSSREMALIHSDQVQITGNLYVQRAAVLEIFTEDRGQSILRVPLEERRKQIEALPWVSQATIRRALPNTLEVDVVERTPLAFLREDGGLSLVDAHGVILENPLGADFHFPVVTGINANMPQDDRERRMQLFAGFMQGVQSARPGAGENVSEVNLADEHDVRAMITGLQGPLSADPSGAAIDAPLLVHFGDSDFEPKYATLLDKIAEVRAKTGPLDSLDLRFNGELVANPDPSAVAQKTKPRALAAAAKHSH